MKELENPTLLRKNPMFRLSMSSLELFHSNFLEWLFDLNHEAFLKCFGLTVSNSATYTIEREYHLGTTKLVTGKNKQWVTDIAVFEKADDKNEKKKKAAKTDKNKKLILIIENKIKSTPSKGQLENQSKESDKKAKGCKKVLLSLFAYSGARHNFIPFLYKDLIGEIRTNYASHSQFVPYVKDYCDMLQRLQLIIDADSVVQDAFGKNSTKTKFFTFHKDSPNLETCGIMDAFRKYQAASLADEFEKRFIVTNPTSLPMTCEHSLNNKHACTTIAYELSDRLNVGVQIEHDQLRIFFEDKKKNFNIPNVHKCWNSWFNVDPGKIQGVAKKDKNQQYCSYDMSKSLFIYRYVKLDDIFDSSPITINDLCIYVEGILDQINKNSSAIISKVLI